MTQLHLFFCALLQRGASAGNAISEAHNSSSSSCTPRGLQFAGATESEMPMGTIDVKLKMEYIKLRPSPRGRTLARQLLAILGGANDRGYSMADSALRLDEGAVAPGQPIVGGLAQPGAADKSEGSSQ